MELFPTENKLNTEIVLKKIKVLVSFSLLLKTGVCAFFKLKAFNITQNKFQTNPVGIGSITPNDDWSQLKTSEILSRLFLVQNAFWQNGTTFNWRHDFETNGYIIFVAEPFKLII